MKAFVIRLVVAAVLFAAGAAVWAEARVARRIADAYQRLATLHYDVDDRIGDTASAVDRLPLQVNTLGSDVRRHRATVTYWRNEFDALTAPLEAAEQQATLADPALMLIRTNAAFRESLSHLGEPTILEKFDAIVNDYAEVLRKDPTLADASYNLEFVVGFRDRIAKMRPRDRVTKGPLRNPDPTSSADLPMGPTLYGFPGGPPPDLPGAEFKTITPMPSEERDDVDPGRGVAPRRRG